MSKCEQLHKARNKGPPGRCGEVLEAAGDARGEGAMNGTPRPEELPVHVEIEVSKCDCTTLKEKEKNHLDAVGSY